VRILASERTSELVRGEIACASLGDFPLKGLPQPVRVYAIRSPAHGS
jgi:class 3 adenylate cyclase